MKKFLLEITEHYPSDTFVSSSYPGPGAYLTSANLVLVTGDEVYAVSRSHIPPIKEVENNENYQKQGNSITEECFLKALAIVCGRPSPNAGENVR